MAWIFQLWIESDENGEEIRNYFLSKNELITNRKKYKIEAYQSGETGSMVTVNGISLIGIQSKNDAEEMTEIGFKFYDFLKNAPNFRYALVGVEVDGWREVEELLENPNEIIMKGFVISEKFYQQIKCTVKMKIFKNDYLWLPYEGEEYIELKIA